MTAREHPMREVKVRIAVAVDTYRIGVWDHDLDDWETVASGLTKWGIRTTLRRLYSHGYTQSSIQVKAETHNRTAARWDRGFVASTELPRSVRRRLTATLPVPEAVEVQAEVEAKE